MSDPSTALTLDALVEAYSAGAAAPEHTYATPEHAGLASVLDTLVNQAQRLAARDVNRYDHRSLYEFAATLQYTLREGQSS